MNEENTLSAQAEILIELHAAARFLRWCKANEKNTDLAEEWLLGLVERLQ